MTFVIKCLRLLRSFYKFDSNINMKIQTISNEWNAFSPRPANPFKGIRLSHKTKFWQIHYWKINGVLKYIIGFRRRTNEYHTDFKTVLDVSGTYVQRFGRYAVL